jgi:hypothetical protein
MRGTGRTARNRLAVAAMMTLALTACSERTPVTTEASAPELAANAPANGSGQCMAEDVASFGGGPVNCTANDTRIARATARP